MTNAYPIGLYFNYTEKFIERIERINGIETRYTLFSNGSTDIKVESYEEIE